MVQKIIDDNNCHCPQGIAVYNHQQWCIKDSPKWQQIQTMIGRNALKPL